MDVLHVIRASQSLHIERDTRKTHPGTAHDPYLKQTKTIKNQNKKVDNDNNETLDKMKADFIEECWEDNDNTDALNIEGLCFQLMETYVSEMNVKLNESQVERKSKILTRGAKFKCDQCDKTFRKRLKLEEHDAVHAGFKPYECHLCLKGFSLKSNLKNLAREDTSLPFLLKELLRNEPFVTK